MTRMLEGVTLDDLIELEEEHGVEVGSRQSLRIGRRIMEEELNRPQHKKRLARKCKNKKDR